MSSNNARETNVFILNKRKDKTGKMRWVWTPVPLDAIDATFWLIDEVKISCSNCLHRWSIDPVNDYIRCATWPQGLIGTWSSPWFECEWHELIEK